MDLSFGDNLASWKRWSCSLQLISLDNWCFLPLTLKNTETSGGFLFVCFLFKNYLFIYLWLCWVFVSVRGLFLVAASGGHSSSRCAGLSLSRPLLLQSTGSRRTGSVVVAHGPSCSVACGILPDQGSNPCALHWQADSQPLRHQGSPETTVLKIESFTLFSTVWRWDSPSVYFITDAESHDQVPGNIPVFLAAVGSESPFWVDVWHVSRFGL